MVAEVEVTISSGVAAMPIDRSRSAYAARVNIELFVA